MHACGCLYVLNRVLRRSTTITIGHRPDSDRFRLYCYVRQRSKPRTTTYYNVLQLVTDRIVIDSARIATYYNLLNHVPQRITTYYNRLMLEQSMVR